MGRNFASQGCLGSITWDGRADSFESHMIQDCSVNQDQMDLPLGLRWGPHILGNTGGDVLQGTSRLSKCTRTRVLFGALGRNQAATERKQ